MVWPASDERMKPHRNYREALEIKPDYPEVHNNLGVLLAKSGRVDEAMAEYQTALELNPDYPEAHNNLGNALARSGRLDEAIIHFQRALELQPDFAEVHNNLGSALHDKGTRLPRPSSIFGRRRN